MSYKKIGFTTCTQCHEDFAFYQCDLTDGKMDCPECGKLTEKLLRDPTDAEDKDKLTWDELASDRFDFVRSEFRRLEALEIGMKTAEPFSARQEYELEYQRLLDWLSEQITEE